MRSNQLDTTISKEVPETSVIMSEDKKADVLINLMQVTRQSIIFWTEKAYKITAWSVGLQFAVVGYWFLHLSKNTLYVRILFAVGIVTFGVLAQVYLRTAKEAHDGNGLVLAKIEAALGLCDLGTYINGERFFGYSGKWLSPTSIIAMEALNLVTTIACSFALLFLSPIVAKL